MVGVLPLGGTVVTESHAPITARPTLSDLRSLRDKIRAASDAAYLAELEREVEELLIEKLAERKREATP